MPGRNRGTSSNSEMCLYVIAIFIPPLAVAMRMGHGVSGCDVVINILLWILGFIPGVIHAFWLVSKSFKYAPRTQVVYQQQQQPIVHHGHHGGPGAPAGYGTAGYGAAPARY
ncbi:hypothetical protein JCM8208_005897 [Rhodotorula glutinis]